jgi:hypothetical protein
MPTFADHDAEQVAHGIRLGGIGETLDTALGAAGEPLTVAHLEDIARPDLHRQSSPVGNGLEHVGMLGIFQGPDGYVIAAQWFGWLPGRYTTRDAALIAYGYVLGGEAHGYLEDISKRRALLRVEDIEALAAQ